MISIFYSKCGTHGHADISCSTNEIVLENQLPGSPSDRWDVNGAGSEEVQGFSTRMSVLPGAVREQVSIP